MPSSKPIGVTIVGGTGFGAGELIRLLRNHPKIEIQSVISKSQAGERISDLHPHLKNICTLNFSSEIDFLALKKYEKAIIVTALPHGTSVVEVQKLWPSIIEHKIKLVDLSGDFRLSDLGLREKFYGQHEVPNEIYNKFVYGLSEIAGNSLLGADFVSNPGCLASACILAASPIRDLDFEGQVVFDAKTGTSGAGKAAGEDFLHSLRHSDVRAYKILEHRHEPEICQALGAKWGKGLPVSFVPHVVPTARGIVVTLHGLLKQEISKTDLNWIYNNFYRNSSFVRICERTPGLRNVLGSNYCDIFVEIRGRQIAVISMLDNLVKGMSGQAIQNINLMCGEKESLGLDFPAMGII